MARSQDPDSNYKTIFVTMAELEPTQTDALLELLKLQRQQREKDYNELLPIVLSAVHASVILLLDALDDDDAQERRRLVEVKRSLRLHTQLSRGPRKNTFHHHEALYCIYRDFLGPIPKFPGDQFRHFFRISRERFVKLMQDVMSTNDPFYKDRRGPSIEAMLLLPIQVLALGVSSSSLCHYFQMSRVHDAKEACRQFDRIVFTLYSSQYLSRPTPNDLKNILQLHTRKHRVSGIMGSLDCTHFIWKNCPKAWEGSFKGKEKKTTIILEAACDYNHYFWHASFGFPGSLNDVNVLRFSSLYKSFYDGSLHEVEEASGMVPYTIGTETFDKVFFLTDGIYPPSERFVKPIASPIDATEKKIHRVARKSKEGYRTSIRYPKEYVAFCPTPHPIAGHSGHWTKSVSDDHIA